MSFEDKCFACLLGSGRAASNTTSNSYNKSSNCSCLITSAIGMI